MESLDQDGLGGSGSGTLKFLFVQVKVWMWGELRDYVQRMLQHSMITWRVCLQKVTVQNPSGIGNCDESGAQVGRNGGGRVLTKIGVWNVHSIIPKERVWLSILLCMNAIGYHIPSFYIFQGKSFQWEYIKHYEDNASMAMQPKAWMIGHLFNSWIRHFVKNVRDCGLQISPCCHHLLILDGYRSHVTVDVVKTACSVGLDLLTLLFYTSHAMQPLDISCFKPFKQAFRFLRNV